MDKASSMFASAVKSAKKKAEAAKNMAKSVTEEGVKAAKEAMGVQSKGKSSKTSSSSSTGQFTVVLERTALCSTLGLQMASDPKGLYVNSIGEGLVSDWNVCNDESTRIMPGDRLVAIESDVVPLMRADQSNISDCLEVLKKSGLLHLTLERAAIGTLVTPASQRSSSGSRQAAAARPNTVSQQKQPKIDDRAISGLCALGFSAAAARHALVRCGGNPNNAALWLEDPSHADEIATAEMVAETEENELMTQMMAMQARENAVAQQVQAESLDDCPELRQELLEKLGVKPRQFNISISKESDQADGSSKKLGLDMDSDTCEVLEVKDGLIAEWNSKSSPENQVLKGDVFVAIEGTDNSAAAMMIALKESSSLTITVQRLEDPYCLGNMSTEELHELLLNYNAQAAQELNKTGKAEMDSSCCAAADPISDKGVSAQQRAAMREAAERRYAIGEKNRRTMDDWRREQRAMNEQATATKTADSDDNNETNGDDTQEVPLLDSSDCAKLDKEEAEGNAEEKGEKQPEEDATREAAEEEARQQQVAQELAQKQKAEEDEAARVKSEEEAKKKAEEDARQKEEEKAAKEKAEQDKQQKAEEEAMAQKKKAEEEEAAKLKAEAEAKKKTEEDAKKLAEEEAKRKADEEARQQQVAEEMAQKQKAEEDEAAKVKAEEEAKKKAEEDSRQKEEEEAKPKADEEAEKSDAKEEVEVPVAEESADKTVLESADVTEIKAVETKESVEAVTSETPEQSENDKEPLL